MVEINVFYINSVFMDQLEIEIKKETLGHIRKNLWWRGKKTRISSKKIKMELKSHWVGVRKKPKLSG